MAENVGKVIQISGPAVDVQFEESTMPPIYQALRVTSDGFTVPTPISVILEVQQHLGEGRVRTVAMEATDGMLHRDRRGRLRGLALRPRCRQLCFLFVERADQLTTKVHLLPIGLNQVIDNDGQFGVSDLGGLHLDSVDVLVNIVERGSYASILRRDRVPRYAKWRPVCIQRSLPVAKNRSLG